MSRRTRFAPRSAREVWAAVLFLLMIWVAVAIALIGLSDMSEGGAVALALAGALLILGAGFAWAHRLRRR